MDDDVQPPASVPTGEGPHEDDALEEDHRPRLVRFVMGGHDLLVDVASVLEVLVPGPVTRLPGSADAIAGVTSVRGRIVAVVDPSGALGASAPTGRERFLVVSTPGGPVALVVDRVDAVVAADLDSEADTGPRPTPDPLPGRAPTEGAVVVASATIDGRTLPVIDPIAVLQAAIRPAPDVATAGAGAGAS